MAGATEIYRGNKQIVGAWPSGSPTASAIQNQGYSIFGVSISGAVNSGSLALMVAVSAGAALNPLYDRAGAIYTALPPFNATGLNSGWSLDSNFLAAFAGYGLITLSGAPQTAAAGAAVIWNLKG